MCLLAAVEAFTTTLFAWHSKCYVAADTFVWCVAVFVSQELLAARNLSPLRILIRGPPAAGEARPELELRACVTLSGWLPHAMESEC